MTVFVVLPRAIGPATHKLITMSRLQALCRQAGLAKTRNILATGNLVIATRWLSARVKQPIDCLLREVHLMFSPSVATFR